VVQLFENNCVRTALLLIIWIHYQEMLILLLLSI
jgi:hypothetical protein